MSPGAGLPGRADRPGRLALPDVVVIGAMKCATSAVHTYLDAHPEVCMSRPKELNFFTGSPVAPHDDPSTWWRTGQWHRGVEWYAAQFDPDAAVRGESSPGYTSPNAPEVAARMASVVPDARLVYLVREPVDRAVSQYAHHVRDGAEPRPLAEALLDPGSQYLARSRYLERLEPFLARFDRAQIHVVVAERLAADSGREMAAIYRHVGVDPDWRGEHLSVHVGDTGVVASEELRREFRARVADDVRRLREVLDDDIEEWEAPWTT